MRIREVAARHGTGDDIGEITPPSVQALTVAVVFPSYTLSLAVTVAVSGFGFTVNLPST